MYKRFMIFITYEECPGNPFDLVSSSHDKIEGVIKEYPIIKKQSGNFTIVVFDRVKGVILDEKKLRDKINQQ